MTFTWNTHRPASLTMLSRGLADDEAWKPFWRPGILLIFVLFVANFTFAQTKRVVLVKVDGLPADLVDQYVKMRDPATGKSQLPWIDYVFYKRGTRIANFYVRGMSLSAPSWSLIDTGQHLNIKGNIEFDRLTLHSYDFLNFFPYYVNYAREKQVDMMGPEILDDVKVPLLLDSFPNNERHQSFQLYQRGVRWTTFRNGLVNRVQGLDAKDILDEWTTGFDTRDILISEMERETIRKIDNPKLRYLDFFTSEFDHAAHHNRDQQSQLTVMKHIDASIGRIWTAIERSQLADQTVMVLVSDHGFNSSPDIYSQGYNLVKLLGSPDGGGHHVITKRRLLMDYSIKGVFPFVPLITTTTPDSFYLKEQSTDYPTALLDFDGNERSSVHLRDSNLNVLHILIQQLQRKSLDPETRKAATQAFFALIERKRPEWQRQAIELSEELGALERLVARQQDLVASLPKEFGKADQEMGRDREARRAATRLDLWRNLLTEYSAYLVTLKNLLSLSPGTFNPMVIKIPDYIAKGTMGDQNSTYQLQHYVVGLSDAGLKTGFDGQLDFARSFRTVNYFDLLTRQVARSNVQASVSSKPIDFVATHIPATKFDAEWTKANEISDDVIWLCAGRDKQALILSRIARDGKQWLKYVPVSNLMEDEAGAIHFNTEKPSSGFPLHLFEDEKVITPGSDKEGWLLEWHDEVGWLKATHLGAYSNAIVGLNEQLLRHSSPNLVDEAKADGDQGLLARFRLRQRHLVEADILVMANNHWNFDVRGSNPGGNHGSFFRISTHSTLMFAGGSRTGIQAGAVVEQPYDSLSFAPTIFALLNEIDSQNVPASFLTNQGFTRFPGRVIQEVIQGRGNAPRQLPVAEGTTAVPDNRTIKP